MNRLSHILIILTASGLISGCGPAENDPGPGGVTVGEAKALDEAAAMLDERNAPLVDDSELTE